jgi:hypothetical protein
LNCNNFCLQIRPWETSKKVDHKPILHEKSFVLVALEEILQKKSRGWKERKKTQRVVFVCMKNNLQISIGWIVALHTTRACWHKCQNLSNKYYILELTKTFNYDLHINDVGWCDWAFKFRIMCTFNHNQSDNTTHHKL